MTKRITARLLVIESDLDIIDAEARRIGVCRDDILSTAVRAYVEEVQLLARREAERKLLRRAEETAGAA